MSSTGYNGCSCTGASCNQQNTTNFTYAILQETSGEESESWLYFIRYQGNEDEIKELAKQLDPIKWEVDEDYNAFEMESTYLVSEQTAKEMTKVDLNSVSFHRKFDGKLKHVDLNFSSNDSNRKKIKKANKILANGGIEEFIDGEDVDEEDLVSGSESKSESESDSESSSESESESDTETESEEEKTPKKVPKALNKIPIPRVAQIRRHNKH